jgi:tetratricopeptide (TPR) repeat protein
MLTTILRGVLVGALLVAASSTQAYAQTLVRGTVLDEGKQPIEGAVITFDAVDFVNKRDVKTDRRGQFLFQGLQSGEYRITTEKEGYQTIVQTQQVSLSGKLELNMTMLSLKRPTKPGEASATPELGALAGAVPPSKDEKEAAALRQLATQAMESYRAERYEESATQLSELVTKMPTCGDCYLFLGNSYVALKRNEDAEKALLRAVELNPTVEGYTALTRLYNTQRNFERAAEMSQKAADLAAAPPPAPLATGADGAKPADGAPAAPAAPVSTSASSETLYNQGVVLWNSGKFAEAKAQFEAAIKANSENASAYYQLGLANLNLGQLPQAREAFEGYLKVAPNGPQAAEAKAILGQLPK